jgi:7-carboxy-7-deazaguanine synthase
MPSVTVCELFAGIQGETSHAGLPFAFVRLSGCNLRCRWCDSSFAWEGGEAVPMEEAARRALSFGLKRTLVTGGEPLLQEGAFDLVRELLDRGQSVLVETNGSVPLDRLDRRAVRIVDVKCPGSGESDSTRWENLDLLREGDEVKLVLSGEEDYRYAKDVIARYGGRGFSFLLSPVAGELSPRALWERIVADRLDARFQLQLHKVVWDPETRGV